MSSTSFRHAVDREVADDAEGVVVDRLDRFRPEGQLRMALSTERLKCARGQHVANADSCAPLIALRTPRGGWPREPEVSAPALNGSGAHDASDEHSGAEVRAEHRPHLSAEQRTRAEDRGALSDQMLGVLG